MIFRTRRAVIYQEPNTLESVAQYHHLFRLPIPASPRLPESSERCQLQVALLRQEVRRLRMAMESRRSLVQAASALANLQYAIGRAVLEFGLGGLFLRLFDEVHRSHMSKICHSLSEAKATQRFHRSKKGTESVIETVAPKQEQDAATQSKWLVLRAKDHKMLKSVKYAPANLAVVLTLAMEAAAQQQSEASDSSNSSSEKSLPSFLLMASPGCLSSVAEYHASLTGSLPPSSTPQWPAKERCQWRLNILESKLKELESALSRQVDNPKDVLIPVAQSLTTMQYNLSGAVLEFGMASAFQSIFDEVHRSHMSEACATVEEAQETVQHYLKQSPELPTGTIPEHPEEDKEEEPSESSDYYYYSPQQVQHGMKWVVYQQGSNQVLKSIKYKPAQLDAFLMVPPSA